MIDMTYRVIRWFNLLGVVLLFVFLLVQEYNSFILPLGLYQDPIWTAWNTGVATICLFVINYFYFPILIRWGKTIWENRI